MNDGAEPTSGPTKRPRRLTAAVVIALVLAAGGATFWAVERAHNYHLATVEPGVLYRDGLKSAAQFGHTLETVHPRTVVSLIDAREQADPTKPQLGQEAQLCAAHGVRLERIPVILGGWPTTTDIRRFLDIVADPNNRPVLVHCAQGVRRTGFFVAAFEESDMGFDKAKATDAILTFGHGEKTIAEIKQFIDGYDPAARTAPSRPVRAGE